MSAIDFSSLDLIPKLLEKIEVLELKINTLEEQLIPKLDLSKRADVKKFLGISESTLMNYISDGRFKINIHFTRELNGNKSKITFLESAIKDFKEKGI